MAKGCGREECGTSTDICGSLTFGTGELDVNGYWENPCIKCEAHHIEMKKAEHRGSLKGQVDTLLLLLKQAYEHVKDNPMYDGQTTAKLQSAAQIIDSLR